MLGAAVSRPNGHIYLIGGENLGGLVKTTATWLYTDPFGSPELQSPLPSARSQGCAVLVDDKFIYYIGGLVSTTSTTNQILRYNISGDTWDFANSLTTARRLAVCVFDSSTREILIMYGTDLGTTGDSSIFAAQKYNVDSNTLTTPSWSLVQNHGSAANAVYDPVTNLTYIIGGNADSTRMSMISQSTGWIDGPTLPNPSANGSAALVNNEIYVFSFNYLQIYTISNSSWRVASLPGLLDDSASNLAPISGPNLHVFAKANKIAPCLVPCPVPSSPCQVNECDIGTGACTISSVDNGLACGNADGCSGSNCVCTDGQCLPDAENVDIQPFFECFRRAGRSATLYAGFLSWNNRASSRAAILKGSSRNKFTGLESPPLNQPDLFNSGVSRSFPLNEFILIWNGSEISWRLTNYDLVIDANTPSLVCPANLTIYITVSGDTLDLADLPLIIPGLARLLGIDQSRLQLRFFIGNKRQSEQTLELEIQDAPPESTEPTASDAVVDFVTSSTDNSTDANAAVSVNNKDVEVIGVSTKPLPDARPGVAVSGPNTPSTSQPSPAVTPTTSSSSVLAVTHASAVIALFLSFV
jgi:hypothetical protein